MFINIFDNNLMIEKFKTKINNRLKLNTNKDFLLLYNDILEVYLIFNKR